MRIHYTSHFPSRINNNTDGLPTCQKAVAPKRIIEVQWFPDAVVLSTRFNFEHSFEVVNIQLRCLRLHCCLQTDEVGLVIVLEVLVGEVDGFSEFPISFSVQLVSPNEYGAVFLVGAEDDDIRRYPLVGFDFYDLSNLEVFAEDVFGAALFDESVDLVVSFLVPLLAVVVVVGLLEEGEAEYEHERGDVGEEEADPEHVDALAERNEEEEEIEEVPELMVEHQW